MRYTGTRMIALYDQVYGEAGGAPLLFDLFRPQTDDALPLVVCIHGGGWISGERSDHHEIAALLAANGFAAACPDYRLAPLHPYPAAIDDVQRFVRFARARSGEIGIRPDLVASFGNSAGGHLSAMLALTDAAGAGTTSSRVDAAVAICPITDLTNPHGQHFPVAHGFLEQFMAKPFEGNEQTYREASPLHCVDSRSAPILVVHGDQDDIVPVGQSEALILGLRALGRPHEWVPLAGEGHALSQEGWATAEKRFLSFLGRTLMGVAA